MKAIVLSETGGPDVLRLQEVPDPIPKPGDLLVEVHAVGLNYIDTYHRGGLYPMQLPLTPGLEGAGIVVDAGSGGSGFKTGDLVAWTEVLGSYAERHAVPAEKAVAIPEGLSERQAAAVILQGVTAEYLVTSTFPVTPGDICLIHAGAGGVGHLLTQMVKTLGATAITTVGSEAKAALSRRFGADLVINYADEDFKDVIVDAYGERPLSVVFDGVGKATFDKSIQLLAPRGTMITFGNASGPVEPVSPLELMRQGSLFLTRPTLKDHISTSEELRRRAGSVFDRVASGALEVHIGAEFPLGDAADAHRALESRETTGKVLLTTEV